MSDWTIFEKLEKEFSVELKTNDDEASLVDPKTGVCIKVFEEAYYSRNMKEKYVEYIVSFTTQHRHYDDLDDAMDFIRELMMDEVLAIEFYSNGKRRFGGDITAEEYENLTVESLAKRYHCNEQQLLTFEYEIHSWSGKHDTGLRSVSELRLN